MALRVLVVDDDRRIADSLCTILGIGGYECSASYSAAEALEQICIVKPHLLISDVVMPGMSGVELLSELRSKHPELPVILLSGNAATEELLAQAGEELGPVTLIAKPCPPHDLFRVVAGLIREGSNARC